MGKILDTRSGAVYAVRAVRVEPGSPTACEEDVVYASGADDEVKEYASLRMMLAEARLASTASASLIVMDGPVVDPPFEPRSAQALNATPRYHEVRASLLSSPLRRGAVVVGFAKRAGGLTLLRAVTGWDIALLGDGEAAYLILSRVIAVRRWCGALIGPLDPPRVRPYTLYRGLRLIYLLLAWWDRVARLEVLGGDPLEAATALARLTPRGLPAPVPVMLAHRAASVPARSVRALTQKLVALLPTLHPLPP
jgi:hypothetical protein